MEADEPNDGYGRAISEALRHVADNVMEHLPERPIPSGCELVVRVRDHSEPPTVSIRADMPARQS